MAPGASTPARLTDVPSDVCEKLRLVMRSGCVGLRYEGAGQVDGRCLGVVRQITAESAAALNSLLPSLEPCLAPAEAPESEVGRNEGEHAKTSVIPSDCARRRITNG